MLSKKSDKNNQGVPEINFIAKGVKTLGDLTCENDLRYDGLLEGNLKVNAKLVLGTDSKIKGTVYSVNADISGNIEGSIEIKETLTLRSSAVINGDIKTNKLIIENGAEFNGSCIMSVQPKSRSEAAKELPQSK